MNIHPPKWVDRFVVWYCNPDLLEEIQGDAHELYFNRVKNEGKAAADRKYIWDVIRFCRWSNIKRTNDEYKPGYFGILFNLNLKIALRNAFRNKFIFSVKMTGLSVCMAFALIISAFVIHEFSFDKHHIDHDRIYRVGTAATIQGAITNYAVSPVAMGSSLSEEIPEIESSCWFMYNGRPVFTLENETFNKENAFIVSSNFLKIFTFDFVQGTDEALDEPYRVVLTESTAKKFFGDDDPLGLTLTIGWTEVEVAAVVKDVPANSHLQFDALISWDTYDINDGWDNINAYTYIKLKDGTSMQEAGLKIQSTLNDHREEMEIGREHWMGQEISITPIIEKISAIHLSGYLDEDVALKRNKTNVYILMAVVILFFITGLINFLNLSLAELTTNLRKISILQVFGGSTANHHKVTITETFVGMLIILPLTALLCYISLESAEYYFSIRIQKSVFASPLYITVAVGFLLAFIFSSRINAFILSRSNDIINSLKGKLSSKQEGFRVRGFLMAVQLSFSIIMIALIVIIVDQFRFINSTDKGFEDKNTLVIKIRTDNFPDAESFEESVRKLSGVTKVDGGSFYLDNVETKYLFEIETDKGATKMLTTYMTCGYDYLDALEIKLINGRNFDTNHGTDDGGAYIINETAAKEFGWKDPIGRRIRGPLGTDRDEGEVIGVVKDFHFASLHSRIEPLIIFLVNEAWGIRYVYIKTNTARPADLIAQIENEYKKSYSDLPFEWEYLDLKYQSLYRDDYEIRHVFQVGLVVSILVSCLGIFSISALLVIMREKEMGIRKVVGATQLQLFLLHIRTFMKFILIAIFIAWPATWFLSNQWLDNFAYHIELNLWYFVIPALATFLIVFITSGYHGIKSSTVNPVDILKHE